MMRRGANRQERKRFADHPRKGIVVRAFITGLVLLLASCPGSLLLAQPKAPPPLVKPPEPPPPPPAPDIQKFTKAYEDAGRPTMAVVSGWIPNPGMADLPQVTDELGQKVENEISLILRKNRDIDLVARGEAGVLFRDQREANLYAMANQSKARDLLLQKIEADVIIVIKYYHAAHWDSVKKRGADMGVQIEMIERSRGRQIGGYNFDWTGGINDAARVKAYSEQMTRRMIDQFAEWYSRAGDNGALRTFTLRVLNLTDLTKVSDIKKTMQKIPGVKKVTSKGFSSDLKGAAVTSFTVDYSGSSLDLAVDLLGRARDELQMKLDGLDTTNNTIVLVAGKQAVEEKATPRGEILSDPEHPQHDKTVKALQAEYRKQNEPRIGIMINRTLRDDEKADPKVADHVKQAEGAADKGQPIGGGTYFYIDLGKGGGRLDAPIGAPAAQPAAAPGAATGNGDLFDPRRMEDELSKLMLKMGLKIHDADTVRSRIMARANNARTVFSENELQYLLSQDAADAGLDIIILGSGRVDKRDPKEAGGGANSISYTLRAVRLSNGRTLGAEGFGNDMWSGGRRETETNVRVFAQHLVGNLLDQMWTTWEPPQEMSVTVTNAKTQRDVMTVMAVFEKEIPTVKNVNFVKHQGGKEGGIGEFRVTYMSTYEDMVKEIIARTGKLPFDLDSRETTRDTLFIKIRD